jgi:hypothetical protein
MKNSWKKIHAGWHFLNNIHKTSLSFRAKYAAVIPVTGPADKSQIKWGFAVGIICLLDLGLIQLLKTFKMGTYSHWGTYPHCPHIFCQASQWPSITTRPAATQQTPRRTAAAVVQ